MKKLFLFTSIIVVLGLSISAFAQVQIESGTWGINASHQNYTLDKNQGNRDVTVEVTFDVPFDEKPDVIIGVTMLDANSEKNIRYKVTSLSVSRDGFTIKVATWAETKIFGISGYWMAYAKKTIE